MPSKPRVDVAAVRRFAHERVEATSLRAVAEEIGVSKSGLDDFLKGREPYSTTRPKLIAWYLRKRRPDGASIRPEEIDAAVALLDEYIHEGGSTEVTKRRAKEITARLLRDRGEGD